MENIIINYLPWRRRDDVMLYKMTKLSSKQYHFIKGTVMNYRNLILLLLLINHFLLKNFSTNIIYSIYLY